MNLEIQPFDDQRESNILMKRSGTQKSTHTQFKENNIKWRKLKWQS